MGNLGRLIHLNPPTRPIRGKDPKGCLVAGSIPGASLGETPTNKEK